ncbi:MAG: peroxiredoxin [Patescibacteria group bacterium]
MKIAINDQVPNFTALDQNNKIYTQASFQGTWVLFYFYPKDFTSGCTKEACGLRDKFGELQKKIKIVGISADSIASHAEFAKKYGLPFTLLADPNQKMINAFGVKGTFYAKRRSFIINPEGKVVKIYKSVDPSKHAEQILKDLEILQPKK